MTYEALKINAFVRARKEADKLQRAINAIKELHNPSPVPDWVPKQVDFICDGCARAYPCPTIQAIEKELA